VFEGSKRGWDDSSLPQFLLDRENYFLFRQYAKEREFFCRSHNITYLPSSSDMRYMIKHMIEHTDAILVWTHNGWQHDVARYGYNWATGNSPPSTVRFGTWETYMPFEGHTGDRIRDWGTIAVNELLKWNPDGATIVFWLTTTDFVVTDEQWEAFKDVTEYMHTKFRHVSLLPLNVERHVVARGYYLSHYSRHGVSIDVNMGQVDLHPLYVKDLVWDPVPADGFILNRLERYPDAVSKTNDTISYDKIEEAVESGITFVARSDLLENVEEFYAQDEIQSKLKEMLGVTGTTNMKSPNYKNHYLTFDGALDPRDISGSTGNQNGKENLVLREDANATILVGDDDCASLYERTYGMGKVIGFAGGVDPLKTYFTDEGSANFGDEYLTRFFAHSAGSLESFRLWDVGKTYLYRVNAATYYALLVERYGIPRDVPVVTFGSPDSTIIDVDTNEIIANGSTIHLDSNSTRLLNFAIS